MRKFYLAIATVVTTALMMGCGDDSAVEAAESAAQVVAKGGGPGWFFILIFVVVPVFVVLVKLFRESEATSDSLISLEGQLRRLNNKIDDLEAGLKGEKKE